MCGFVPDRPHVYEKLTGGEYLAFIADLYSVDGTRSGAPNDCSRCSTSKGGTGSSPRATRMA